MRVFIVVRDSPALVPVPVWFRMACLSGAGVGVASVLALTGERNEPVELPAMRGVVALAPGVRQPPLRTAEIVFVVEADNKPRDLGALCVVEVLLSSRVADAGSAPALDGAEYTGHAGATV